jgi:hypothetical protein
LSILQFRNPNWGTKQPAETKQIEALQAYFYLTVRGFGGSLKSMKNWSFFQPNQPIICPSPVHDRLHIGVVSGAEANAFSACTLLTPNQSGGQVRQKENL